MFPNARNSRIADLTCAALSLARSFLLLEDDDCVDWEVDPNELEGMEEGHPHREPLRGRPSHARRAGQPPSPAQVCLCPIGRNAGQLARSARPIGFGAGLTNRSAGSAGQRTSPASRDGGRTKAHL
ncbi:MAG TPA: hypothetical protein VGF95_04855 [Solirubrobacteraceae bacterium]